jgi:pimeloyl-ACP methyl ester carboxylesterase
MGWGGTAVPDVRAGCLRLLAVCRPQQGLAYLTDPKTLVAQHPALSHSVAPHASHWLMLDSPQWFHAELVRFLGQCRHTH